jgi:hypothetical protein
MSVVQEIDSKVENLSASGGGNFNVSQLSLDTGRSGGLWEPIKIQPAGYSEDKSGRFERSNSLDSHNSLSSDGFGFNARDGSGLYESQSPDSLYGSASPTESFLENISIPPPALTRTASQPNPSAESYLYSPFKSGAATTSASLSERKPPRSVSNGAWSESFHDMNAGMDGHERQQNNFAEITQKDSAPVWLSRNDSASSNSSYGGGQRFSVSSAGDGDAADSDIQMNQHSSRHASQQPLVRPLSGRRAVPLVPLSPMSKFQSNAGSAISQTPAQVHESDHDRRPLPGLRPPVAAAAANSASSMSSEQASRALPLKSNPLARKPSRCDQVLFIMFLLLLISPFFFYSLPQRAWSASAALTGLSDADNGDRAGTGPGSFVCLHVCAIFIHFRSTAPSSWFFSLQCCVGARHRSARQSTGRQAQAELARHVVKL